MRKSLVRCLGVGLGVLVCLWVATGMFRMEEVQAETQTGEDYESKTLLVDTTDGEALDEYAGVTEVRQLADTVYAVDFGDAGSTEEAYRELQEQESVQTVAVDTTLTALGDAEEILDSQAVPTNYKAWGVKAIGADSYTGWLRKYRKAKTVTVAVLDTGINAQHEAFYNQSSYDRLSLTYAYDYVNNDSGVDDDNGHGTMVAGIIAESSPTNVKILPAKVLNAKGEGKASDIVEAIYDVYKYTDVINLSLGADPTLFDDEAMSFFEKALKTASDRGVIIVAAAGNAHAEKVYYPASSSYALAVSSVNSSLNFSSSFSNYGAEIAFAMPGEQIIVPSHLSNTSYKVASGTSMSSPFLAVATALTKLEYPSYSKADLIDVLKNDAVDLGAEGWDKYYGYGMVNFTARVEQKEQEEASGINTEGENESNTNSDESTNGGVASGIYIIRSAIDSGKVLDIYGGSTTSGANLQLYNDNATAAQKFILRHTGDGVYEIENIRSGKLLDAQGGGMVDYTNVWQYNGNGTCAQHWRIKKASDNYYSFVSECSGLYLDVSGGVALSGVNIQLYHDNDTKAQKFSLQMVESIAETPILANGTYIIRSELNSNMVLDINGGSTERGANLQLYSANGTEAQSFQIRYLRDGFYEIVNTKSGKVIDVSGGSSDIGTNVWQYDRNGTVAQQWLIERLPSGEYVFVSRCNLLYLDVSGGNPAKGTNMQIWRNNGTKAQKFILSRVLI